MERTKKKTEEFAEQREETALEKNQEFIFYSETHESKIKTEEFVEQNVLEENQESVSDSEISASSDVGSNICQFAEQRQQNALEENREFVSDSESSAYSDLGANFGRFGDELVRLEEGDEEYGFVQCRFLSGLDSLCRYTSVVGIHRNSYSSLSGQTRLQAFQMYSKATADKCCGNANIRYAWRRVSREELPVIILHGFGRHDRPKTGALFGIGLYLSPEDSSINSAASSIMDGSGVQHMVFCRVIMGNMEQVALGSEQFHPSSDKFDSGVDNQFAPKRYIVWTTHMNTHILPEYIVSFKFHPCLRELWSIHYLKRDSRCDCGLPVPDKQLAEWRHSLEKHSQGLPSMLTRVAQQRTGLPVRKPTSAWMPFPRLISVLSRVLPSSAINLIKRYHSDFLENKITREYLIKRVRQIAGDKLLTAAIKRFRAKVVTANASEVDASKEKMGFSNE